MKVGEERERGGSEVEREAGSYGCGDGGGTGVGASESLEG